MNKGKKGAAAEILLKPYSRVLVPDADTGTYAAFILEFPGCVAQGDSPEEAYRNLEAAARSWIEAAMDLGQKIPGPISEESHSGRVLLRLPRSVHRRAAEMAQRDHTSLNQFILAAVAERVGTLSSGSDLGSHSLEEADVLAAEVAEPRPETAASRRRVMEKAMALSPGMTKAAVIGEALAEYARRRSLARYRDLPGKFQWEGSLDELRGRTPSEPHPKDR